MSVYSFEFYRSKLEEEKKRLEKKINSLDSSGIHKRESLRDSTQELSLYDNHPGDLGSELFERGKDLSLRESEQKTYQNVLEAIKKMDSGAYGTCEKCGLKIDPARLAEIPEASLCFECKSREEQRIDVNDRPIEEKSFGTMSTFMKDSKDYLAFDGEDTWEELAEYNKTPKVYYESEHDEENKKNEGYIIE